MHIISYTDMNGLLKQTFSGCKVGEANTHVEPFSQNKL